MSTLLSPDPASIWSVSQLTQELKRLLQAAIPPLWIEGEVSNLMVSGVGHAYLTLKDEQAQLRAVCWRNDFAALPFQLKDGMSVLAFGSIDLYAPRGQYQWTIRKLLPKGIGPLELAFRQLCEKLAGEGLFDPQRKRPIPRFARRIAVITSPRGAAIRDFLEVAGRRWQGSEIIVCPASVQGDRAALELIVALRAAQTMNVDVIVLIRGGGSLEDLWPFNDENLAREIFACTVPVVTGIGHEIDVTIADLVADLRALTPSEAAERIFPDGAALQRQLLSAGDRLAAAVSRTVRMARHRLDFIESTRPMRFPLDRVRELSRRIDELERGLCGGALRVMERSKQAIQTHARALDALSPLQVLQRGYGLVSATEGTRLIQHVADAPVGSRIAVRLIDGRLVCLVEQNDRGHDSWATRPIRQETRNSSTAESNNG